MHVQQSPPADSLLAWKRTAKTISCEVVVVVKASEIDAPRGAGQGKSKRPDLKAVIKPAFNKHAVREPGTQAQPDTDLTDILCIRKRTASVTPLLHAGVGNVFGMTFLEFYTGIVVALSEGKQVDFTMAKSKPRVRDATHAHGHSARMKEVESSRRDSAIAQIQSTNPALLGRYDQVEFEVCPDG